MYLHAILMTGILLSGVGALADTGDSEVCERHAATRQQVENCRRELSAAQSRLIALQTEHRIQSALFAAKPATPPKRNPEFERLQTAFSALELQTRKLSDRMAPAHPERIATEAELDTIRDQLAATPEFLDAGPSAELAATRSPDSEISFSKGIARAESDLHRAEQHLASALEGERRALAKLLTLSRTQPAAVVKQPAQVQKVEVVQFRNAGWIMAGMVSAVLLLVLIASRSRVEKSPPQIPSTTALPPSPPSRRIIYSAGETPAPAAFHTKPQRNPIVPRRRVS
jgi:hypothetical protein